MANLKVKRSKSLPNVLDTGDSVEASVSFEAKIDGDSAWIGYKVFARQQDGETTQDLHSRVVSVMEAGIKDTVEIAVQSAREIGE